MEGVTTHLTILYLPDIIEKTLLASRNKTLGTNTDADTMGSCHSKIVDIREGFGSNTLDILDFTNDYTLISLLQIFKFSEN